jgi:hypothetical protein
MMTNLVVEGLAMIEVEAEAGAEVGEADLATVRGTLMNNTMADVRIDTKENHHLIEGLKAGILIEEMIVMVIETTGLIDGIGIEKGTTRTAEGTGIVVVVVGREKTEDTEVGPQSTGGGTGKCTMKIQKSRMIQLWRSPTI